MPRAKPAGILPAERMARMAPQERTHMIEWLGLERVTDGKAMLNWRWIYGGAAKGQNMCGDASDVHASSGYSSMAKYVNEKSFIKSDKHKAWTADTAEKRWTYIKGLYRKAVFLPAPDPIDNDEYEEEQQMYLEKQEQVCGDFAKLHKLLKDHPSTQPAHVVDTMSRGPAREKDDGSVSDDRCDDYDEGHSDPEVCLDEIGEGQSRKSVGSKRSGELAGTTPKKHKETRKETKQDAAAKKKPVFYLKKETSESSHKKTDIQTLFIQSQQKQVEAMANQQRVTAVLGLIAQGISTNDMAPYLNIMFGTKE
jgi:hypothetical protein